MNAEPHFVTAFEAAHLIAFGEVRSKASYQAEIAGFDSAMFKDLRLFEHLGQEKLDALMVARDVLHEAARAELTVRGRLSRWRAAVHGPNAEQGSGTLKVWRDALTPPDPLDVIASSYFLAPDYHIDIFAGTLVHPPAVGAAEKGGVPIMSERFEELRFESLAVKALRPHPLPPWHPEERDTATRWVDRPEVRKEAERQLVGKRISRKAMGPVLQRMCGGLWTAGTLEKALGDR